MNPRYAKHVPVFIPRDDATVDAEDSDVIATQLTRRESKFADRDMRSCYEGIQTLVVVLEERNVYCGAYNVLVLQDGWVHLSTAYFLTSNGSTIVVQTAGEFTLSHNFSQNSIVFQKVLYQ